MQLRKTKIVCTMGPATQEIEIVKKLLIAGMNVARFNFSHGDHEEHRQRMNIVRKAGKETGIPVALLLDTKGPEIRTGNIKNDGTINLVRDNKITLTVDEVEGTERLLSVSYKALPEQIKPGKHIFIADGLIDLEVEKVEGKLTHCIIKSGGEIGSKKNMNILGVRVNLPAITEKDESDILFGIDENLDYIAASFIRKPEDVIKIRKILNSRNSHILVIAKIEDQEGLDNIEEIIRVSDGIMVARGDLGVQLPTEEIPLVQKRIIGKCNAQNKVVITATQMLDSMIHNPKPTRAESTDVANAIFDGTDAIMLSGETASGRYPVLAVETMHKIAIATEASAEYADKAKKYFRFGEAGGDIARAVTKAAFLAAREIEAAAIITPTLRGSTPKLISKYRPMQNIIAVTPNEQVLKQLLLYWGVFPILGDLALNSDEMLNNSLRAAIEKGYVQNFEKVVMVAGVPIHSPIMINMIKVYQVCNVLNKGERGFGDVCTGRIAKVISPADVTEHLKEEINLVILSKTIDASFLPVLPRVSGIILEDFSEVTWD
ncbi:MAG: pyruvate kinase, partial [Spirochaetota bacterium]